jgi:hypothetical protein
MIEIEAVRLKSGWFVHPKGACGTMGWHPVPWEITYIKGARNEQDALHRARQAGVVRWLK